MLESALWPLFSLGESQVLFMCLVSVIVSAIALGVAVTARKSLNNRAKELLAGSALTPETSREPKDENKWEKVTSISTLLTLIVVASFSIFQSFELLKADQVQNSQLQGQVWVSILERAAEITKLKIATPDVQPYFEDNLDPADITDGSLKSRVMLIAEMHLDFFDSLNDPYVKAIPKMGDSGEDRALWETWIAYSFEHSRAICLRYSQIADTYTSYLAPIAKKACSKERTSARKGDGGN